MESLWQTEQPRVRHDKKDQCSDQYPTSPSHENQTYTIGYDVCHLHFKMQFGIEKFVTIR